MYGLHHRSGRRVRSLPDMQRPGRKTPSLPTRWGGRPGSRSDPGRVGATFWLLRHVLSLAVRDELEQVGARDHRERLALIDHEHRRFTTQQRLERIVE